MAKVGSADNVPVGTVEAAATGAEREEADV